MPMPPEHRRILIVEDNQLNQKLLADILEFNGFLILTTQSGLAAVDLAREHRPDLILMDIQLPDISGTAAAQLLKTDEQTRRIPIVAVTAFAMPGDRARFLASGCDDYVSKPLNISELLKLVGRYTASSAAGQAKLC